MRIIRKDGTTDFLYEYRKQNKVEEYRRQYRRPTTLDLPKGTVSKKLVFDIMNSCHFRNSYTCRTLICTSLDLFVVNNGWLMYMKRYSSNNFNSVYEELRCILHFLFLLSLKLFVVFLFVNDSFCLWDYLGWIMRWKIPQLKNQK